MKHLRPLNKKARLIEQRKSQSNQKARAMADVPFGCSTQRDPGWEVDSGGGTYGL